MDYRKLAQYELQSVDQLVSALKNSKVEIAELNMTIRSIKLVKNGSADEDGLKRVEMQREELRLRQRLTRAHLSRINVALKSLPDQDRRLLIKYYKDGDTIDDVLDSECCERSTFYRRRGEVLERFTRAMYGVVVT